MDEIVSLVNLYLLALVNVLIFMARKTNLNQETS